MLSYRHAFHAAGAADVLKHSVLIFCIEYLLQKEKPLLCVDTHAGAGTYALREGYAAQNREWEQGLGKFFGRTAQRHNQLPSMLSRYLGLCGANGDSADPPDSYDGSPVIMARLLRPADRLVCYELHPADYAACTSALTGCAMPEGRFELRQEDGFVGLKSLLPPPSRRGLIIIDPSYELKDDYERVPGTLVMALGRFATGTYIIWYPLLREIHAAGRELPQRLMGLYRGNRCRVELYTTCRDNSPRGMYGSGLVIYNPPWTLAAALRESLPILGSLMGTGEKDWSLEFIPKEERSTN
jgi:23S rRNA (adenine2030-N6)-methyltransferase